MVELDQEVEEAAATAVKKSASLRDDIVLASDSITLYSDDTSLVIHPRLQKYKGTISNFEKTRFTGDLRRSLRDICKEVKKTVVEEMAADILTFFIQPEESSVKKLRCGVEHVQYLLRELVRISFTYEIDKDQSTPETAVIFFNFHHEFLQREDYLVEELRRTLRWTGKDDMQKLKIDNQLELIRTHRSNRDRTVSERRRVKLRAYFV